MGVVWGMKIAVVSLPETNSQFATENDVPTFGKRFGLVLGANFVRFRVREATQILFDVWMNFCKRFFVIEGMFFFPGFLCKLKQFYK